MEKYRVVLLCVSIFLILSGCSHARSYDLDGKEEENTKPHRHHRQHHRHGKNEEQEVNATSVSAEPDADLGETDPDFDTPQEESGKVRKGGRSRGARKRKLEKEKLAEQERGWHYCSDGRRPKNVKDLDQDEQGMGHMCRDLYPSATCCYDHDLTMELVGDQILEQIPDMQCSRMLMKLRCAHCSPRSWWLFHAPDKVRYPHKRVLPIMCPSFCKKFHRLCRDLVAGLESDTFCDYHTTNEDGPCFPDSVVKRGTID